MLHVTCYMLHVTCHILHVMSHVTYHMSHVTCHMLHECGELGECRDYVECSEGDGVHHGVTV